MRILITGIAGFIGSHLAEAFLEAGHEVIGVDNLVTGREANVPVDADFILGDIVVPQVMAALPAVDVVYHCAASYKDRDNWERDARTNVIGTIHVLRYAMAHHAKVIYTQTSLCYGLNPKSPITVDAPLDPHGSYAVSKTAAEGYIRDSPLPYVSLRLANVYGPRNLSGPIPAFFKRLSAGEPCTVVDTRRDFIYIADLVDLAVQMAEKGHGVFHVSTGLDLPIVGIYNTVVGAMGLDVDSHLVTPVPRGPDDAATILIDPSLTEASFGWRATTPPAVGIAAAVDWYASNGVADVFTHLAMKG